LERSIEYFDQKIALQIAKWLNFKEILKLSSVSKKFQSIYGNH
jgi:hypothetical protein